LSKANLINEQLQSSRTGGKKYVLKDRDDKRT